MPHVKRPRSLRDLSLAAFAELIEKSCVAIHDRHHGNNACSKRIAEARLLRTHLAAAAWPLLDEVCTYIFSGEWGTRARCEAADVLLLAMVNKRTRSLRYPLQPTGRFKTNLSWDFRLWQMLVEETPNLLELDLSGVDYSIDGILRIVGSRCFQLQVICIGEGKVSQSGLCYLAVVDTLRVIKNSYPEILFVTKNANDLPCVRLLLRSLPRLEHVHCSCMGEILRDLECEGSLALTQCWETQPTPRKIDAIARLCPNLDRLELGHPVVYNRSFDLAALTNSTILVSSLKLTDFCFTESLGDYFAIKGHHLKELEIYNLDEIKFEQMTVIGRYCRNLEVLKIYLEVYFESSYVPPRRRKHVNVVDERFFAKLLHFELEVDGQSDAMRLLECLAAARRIRTFTFRTQSVSELHDENHLESVLSEMIRANPTPELESLILVGPFTLSKKLIEHFYNLPNLSAWKLDLCLAPEVDAYLEGLRNKILQNHLELRYIY